MMRPGMVSGVRPPGARLADRFGYRPYRELYNIGLLRAAVERLVGGTAPGNRPGCR